MDNESHGVKNDKTHGLQAGSCYSHERAPPGLERPPRFFSNSLKSTFQASNPPPGLGPTFAFSTLPPNNNNVFFQLPQQDAGYSPFYSPQGLGFPSYFSVQNKNEIGEESVVKGNSNSFQYQLTNQNQPPRNSKKFIAEEHVNFASYDSTHLRGDFSEPVGSTSTGVIEPMIENLVGSMGNSNGTYSHFGPSAITAMTGLTFGQGIGTQEKLHRKNTNPLLNSVADTKPLINNDPFNSSPEWEFQRKMEAKIRQKQLLKQECTPNGVNSKANLVNLEHGNMNASNIMGKGPLMDEKLVKTPSPKPLDGPCSRPQTPVKPSYLEILTKNCPKEKNSSHAKMPGDSLSSKGNFDTSYPLFQVQNQQVHRKSLDSFSPNLGSPSPSVSNPSTASSSPVLKPRAHQKGKENISRSGDSSSGNSKSSSRRNTPAVTPVHQRSETGRKSSSNESNCWVKKLSAKPANGKSNGKLDLRNGAHPVTGSFQFGLETDDIGSVEDFGDDDIEKLEKVQLIGEDKHAASSTSNKKKLKKRCSSNSGSVSDFGILASGPDRKLSAESKGGSYSLASGRRTYFVKEKTEKSRGRKEERNCAIRRVRIYSKQWVEHLLKALTWLWTLLVNVTVLSVSLGWTLAKDLIVWWNITALPIFRVKMNLVMRQVESVWKGLMSYTRKKNEQPSSKPPPDSYDELLSVLGPERNIMLPITGDEALRRLLSVKGQDPYSILGVRSNSSEETIRRYYKKQAVLVHPDKNLTPGAEEAFKILGKAFEMVGEPGSRLNYHQQLIEAHAKERFIGEFGQLFDELRKKMETACSTIRCTKCKGRHKKNKTNRPVFAARYCDQCRIHHGAREGELWAEKSGLFSLTWQFYACMSNHIWEINEWGRCQRSSLQNLRPNAHIVIYRLVSSAQQQTRTGRGPTGVGGCNSTAGSPNDDDMFDPEMEDWDSLIHNLYRNSSNATNHYSYTAHKGSGKPSAGSGGAGHQGNGPSSSTTASGKKRKGKRK